MMGKLRNWKWKGKKNPQHPERQQGKRGGEFFLYT